MNTLLARAVLPIFLLTTLVSCNWLSSKEKRTQKIAEKELLTIDWNEIDHYPLFKECDETSPKEVQKECFEEQVLRHISRAFEEQNFVFDTAFNDSVYVDFVVNRQGRFQVSEIERNAVLMERVPDLNRIINRGFSTIPHVEPALKRGTPVSTKFRIPISFDTQ